MGKITKKLTEILLGVMFVSLLLGNSNVYADNKELNIYAIYLNNDVKGESVLLESRGQYLLMDIGADSHLPAVIDQLQTLGVREVSIYFSHLHTDHIGATMTDRAYGLRMINNAGIGIRTLYLPTPELATLSRDYVNRYNQITDYMRGRGNIVYLQKGSTFYIGDATGEVVGPLDSNIKPSDYAYKVSENATTDEAMYTQYENNRSLITIITCGNKKFFSGGDCLEDEAREIVREYKYNGKLDCDVMKLCHHGTGGGNTADLINAVSPEYTFASNTAYTGVSEVYGRTLTAVASRRAAKYGAVYLVGSQKKTLIIQIKNDIIHLFSGKQIEEGKQFVGLKTFKGSDGVKRTSDTYYFKEDGHLMTGIQKIGNYYFNFGQGGCMEYGSFSDAGKYKGWKTQNGEKRYYELSKDGKYAYLQVGFSKINKKLYYFSNEGYLKVGNAGELTTINGSDYFVNSKGVIYTDGWYYDSDGNKYYIQTDGTPVKNKIQEADGTYYIFGTDGVVFIPETNYEITEYKGNSYIVCKSGACKRSFMYTTEDGETVYFGKNARRVYDSMITYHGDKYYVDAAGNVVKDAIIKLNNKYYYFNKKGTMAISKWITIGEDKLYFNKKGTMVVNQKIKIGAKYYYFNKNGVMVTDKYMKIGGKRYYFDENGVMEEVKNL